MSLVKINDISIRLDAEDYYYEIDDLFYGYPTVNVEFLDIDKGKLERILFLGFPVNATTARNIAVQELRDHKIKGNNALQSIFEVITKSSEYDYFFIATSGIDPIGIEFLKKLPAAFDELSKRLFIIHHKKIDIEFSIVDGKRTSL